MPTYISMMALAVWQWHKHAAQYHGTRRRVILLAKPKMPG
jgi:hypothetical protein